MDRLASKTAARLSRHSGAFSRGAGSSFGLDGMMQLGLLNRVSTGNVAADLLLCMLLPVLLRCVLCTHSAGLRDYWSVNA